LHAGDGPDCDSGLSDGSGARNKASFTGIIHGRCDRSASARVARFDAGVGGRVGGCAGAPFFAGRKIQLVIGLDDGGGAPAPA
jgi:hypothetical protein